MYIVTGTMEFPRKKGSGPHVKSASVPFPRNIQEAFVVMTSFEGGFSPRTDHPLGRLTVNLRVKGWNAKKVEIEGSLGVRDWSGSWDDYYEGHVGYAVIAHLF